MSTRRIIGVLKQELYLTMHSLEVLVDVFLFPLVNIVIFGLISMYLAGNEQTNASKFVFMGMLLWQIIGITSYSVAVGSMWNIWSRNLSNMFIAPLKVKEYVLALFASGCLKALLLLVLGMVLSVWFFGFDVLDIGLLNLTLLFIVFALFGFALAIVIVGIIFRFGTRLAALSWSLPWLFQPLSAAFFPLADLPLTLQMIAYVFPSTYAFEAARSGLLTGGTDWSLFLIGIGLAIIYCVLGALVFSMLYDRSKDTGQFARNES